MKLEFAELERVAEFFRAFAEPTRLALLQELKAGECSVGELVAALPTTQANISRQLRVLHEVGLVGRRRAGTRVFYSIIEPRVMEICRIACDKLNHESPRRKLRF